MADPRVAAIAQVLRDVLGPSPVEVPFGYDAVTIAEKCVREADAVDCQRMGHDWPDPDERWKPCRRCGRWEKDGFSGGEQRIFADDQ